MKLIRLRALHSHLGLLLNVFETNEQLQNSLAVEPHHIYIDELPTSYKQFLDDIAFRRQLKEVVYLQTDNYLTKEDRKRSILEKPYVRIDLARNGEDEPTITFNAFFFLGEFDNDGNKQVNCFKRDYEVFADSFEGAGTLGKLFRLMTEINLLDKYEEMISKLQVV